MFHPVGDQPLSVYWRRRAIFVTVAALAVVTLYAVFFRGDGGTKASAGSTAARTTPVANQSVVPTPATIPVSSTSLAIAATAPTVTPPASPVACQSTQLVVGAAADASSYPVGAKPKLSLTVTNNGPAPCIADLADAKIELRVMSGSVRVWGSHDCAVAPGTNPQTLVVGAPVRREIEWSGLSSQPGCAGQRQVVPAGSYKVIALLAGQPSAPVAFGFS